MNTDSLECGAPSLVEEPVEALPVRLAPWLENPYGLVNLLTIMIYCPGERFFWMSYAPESLKTDCMMKGGPGSAPLFPVYFKGPVDEEFLDKIVEWLEPIRRDCKGLGMSISSGTVNDIIAHIKERDGSTYQNLQSRLHHLQDVIRKELGSKFFFYVTPEKHRFFPSTQEPHLFGSEVDHAFPSAVFDIQEAGTCLALARPTASVFHLMRVMEIALTSLGSVFGLSLTNTNWAPAIEQIERKIREMHKDPQWKAMADCKEQQEFYAQIASHFGILKDAWRNYTAHAHGKHTEEEAALIFDNTRALMQKLATKLHE